MILKYGELMKEMMIEILVNLLIFIISEVYVEYYKVMLEMESVLIEMYIKINCFYKI